MDPVSWLGLVGIFILTGFSALASAGESALNETARTDLEPPPPDAPGSVRRRHELLTNRFQFWVGQRLSDTVAILVSATLATTLIADSLMTVVPSRAGSVAIAIVGLALLHAGFARILPRILAQRYPRTLAERLSFVSWLIYAAFRPATRLLERLLSPAEQEAWKAPDPEDAAVLNAVEAGTREGTIDAYDSQMIANVIQLGDRVARQVMTPRPDIVAVPQIQQVRAALALAHEHGLSRLPVYQDDLDSITGILHVREGSAALLDGQPPPDLTSLLRPPLFVPESQRVDLLLRELRARTTHMAIVVNEHGETVGLVTIEDLLEEIVGEIEDEFDSPEVLIEPAGAGIVEADAGVLISEVNEALGLNLAADDVDTIGGLVYNTMGLVPNPGDSVAVDGAALEVLTTNANRIMRVRVRKIASEPSHEG